MRQAREEGIYEYYQTWGRRLDSGTSVYQFSTHRRGVDRAGMREGLCEQSNTESRILKWEECLLLDDWKELL